MMHDFQDGRTDQRHHVHSLLMRESLLDKQVMSATETPVVRMLPDCHVVKVGGRSIIDGGKVTTYPLVEAIGAALSYAPADHRHGRRRAQPARLLDRPRPRPARRRPRAAGDRRRPRQRAHAGHAARAVWGRRHPAGDLRPPPAALHARRAGSHLQRRAAVLALGASAWRGTHPPAPHRRGLLTCWRSASAARR